MASSLDVPDDWGLSGKVAIVTGAGAAGTGIGNGRAAAILLARAGARVIVVDREIGLAEQTARMIKDQGGEGVAFPADVTRAEDCAGMVKMALDRFGRLDFLDNNVGIGSRGSVVDESEENWRRVMQVNVDSMFLMAKHAIPAMRRRGGGAIVNVSSISVRKFFSQDGLMTMWSELGWVWLPATMVFLIGLALHRRDGNPAPPVEMRPGRSS